MNTEEFLDLKRVFLEVTLEDNRCKVFPITSAIFVWEGSYGCYFGVDDETVKSYLAIKLRRGLNNKKTHLADIFNEISYLVSCRGGFILLMQSTGERAIVTEDKKEHTCREYQPILASSIKNISVLIDRDGSVLQSNKIEGV